MRLKKFLLCGLVLVLLASFRFRQPTYAASKDNKIGMEKAVEIAVK